MRHAVELKFTKMWTLISTLKTARVQHKVRHSQLDKTGVEIGLY